MTYLFVTLKLHLVLLGSGLWFLLSISCSTPHSPIPVSESKPSNEFLEKVDSLIANVKSVDSLRYWTDLYAKQNNAMLELRLRLEMGKLYLGQSNYMEAIDEHNRSLILSEQVEDTAHIIESLNLLGASNRLLGVIGQSADFYFRALELGSSWSDKMSDAAKKSKVQSLNGIGDAQMTLGNLMRAEESFRKALEIERQLKNHEGQAVTYANIGMVKEQEGFPDSAFVYYERSLEMNRYVNSKLGIALCYNHFARLAEHKEDLDAALRYYYRAYYIIDGEQYQNSLMESTLSMARVYLKRGEFENARRYIDEGWNYAVKSHSWKMMAQACMLQSQYDEHLGNYKKALRWYKQSLAYSDSVTNQRTRTFVHKLREDFVRDKNESEMEALRASYSEQKATNRAFMAWAVMAGVFAAMCIAVLLYMLRVRMRSQAMMRHMDKVRTDFFTNITHEFRTPLTVMLGLGKQIAEGRLVSDEKEYRRVGSMIVRQGNSLLDLVNQLLDIVKAESAIGKADWRTGDITPYISMIIENCQEFANQKNVSLGYTCAERDLVMDFVPDYVRKVLQNLLTNAIKYSGEGGKVTVQMSRKGSLMQIVVADTGRGIPEKDLPHIFDAFYTATNFGIEVSAGVGLTMVRQMVMAMKGNISVESTIGRGTTFTLTIPVKQGETTYAAIGDNAFKDVSENSPLSDVDDAVLPEDDVSNSLKACVLVIEDNRDVAAYIGMQFADLYRVIYATNGREGVEKAQTVVPDLIVTDLMMPEMDGYEVCREVRKSEVLSNIPIIIVSAKSTEADRLKGLEAGADAYLYKPFNSEELQLLVANLIGQRRLIRQQHSTDSRIDERLVSNLKPHEREFLNKFVDVVYNQMPKGTIDAESLASSMCMSSSQLRRKILAITGAKLTTYVLQIRLRHALQLLESQGDLPVADVASKCGFEDAAYFSRIFKNVYQMTPSQYRKQGGLTAQRS